MGTKIFWGENGEYGPFTSQEDGWPNAGEVIRQYRRTQAMAAEDLAQHYGHAIGASITARWILRMEQQNKVPTDITRRRILAKLLDIPPVLLGLAALDTTIAHAPTSQTQAQTRFVFPVVSFDLEWYRKEARIFWQLHYAQAAHDSLTDILRYLQDLLQIHQTAQGDLKRHLSELMNSYYRLASMIRRDQGFFAEAYRYANEGVRCAKDIGNHTYALEVVAASQYTRGVVNFAWGVFGNHIRSGRVVILPEKIAAALADFERALKYANPQLKGIIYSEMARAKALLSPSPTEMTIALKLMEQAEHFLDRDNRDDFYTQILLSGDLKGLDKKRLMLGRARTFLAMQRPGKAFEEFSELEMLNAGPTHTRRRGWTQILYAQAAFDLGDYTTAAERAMSACRDCMEVHSLPHLARARELYLKLRTSPYKDHNEVKRLGKLLSGVFPNAPEGDIIHALR